MQATVTAYISSLVFLLMMKDRLIWRVYSKLHLQVHYTHITFDINTQKNKE
jgi:hypothetical protein